MKLHHRNVGYLFVSLICLGSLSCLRGIDATELRCTDSKYCPGTYVCDIPNQKCVAKGSIDALGSQEVGRGDGPRAEVVVSSGQDGGKQDATLPAVARDGAAVDSPIVDPGTGGTGGAGGTGGEEGTGGTGGVEDTGGTGGTAETGGITAAGGSVSGVGGNASGGTGGNASGETGGTSAGGVGGTIVRDAAPDTVDAFVPLAIGSRCTTGSQCASTFCADGVCCDTKCDGQCETCSAAGKCTLASAGPAPAARTACPGTGTCGSKCDGTARTCVYPTGAPCSDPTCTAGSATAAGTCSSSGTCVKPDPAPCSTGVCGTGGLCADRCNSTSCPSGYYCNTAFACALKKNPGATCANSNECGNTAPFCSVEGICCNSECTGSCVACNSSGNCTRITGTPRTGHAACTISSSPNCSGTCDGTSDSCVYPDSNTLCTAGAPYTCDTSTYLSRIPPKTCNGLGDCNASNPAAVSCGTGYYCSGGSCPVRGASGATCTAPATLPAIQAAVQCAAGLSCVSNNTGGNRCCPGGQSACGGTCTDITTNNNCGACGTTCGANQSCKSQLCQCENGTLSCSSGTSPCNSENFESGSSSTGRWSILRSDGTGTVTLGWTASTYNGSSGALSVAFTSTSMNPSFVLKYSLCSSGRTPVSSVSFDFYTRSTFTNGPSGGSYLRAEATESDVSVNARFWTDPTQQIKTGGIWYPVSVTLDPTFNGAYLYISVFGYSETSSTNTTILIDNVIVR